MTTEELLALGITQEQANQIFAINGRDLTALRGQVATLTTENTNLQTESQELATLKQKNMTAEQLQQQAIDAANEEKGRYIKMQNSLKARENLINGGLKPDEIDESLLEILVTDDEQATLQRCKAYTDRIATKLSTREQELREELLKGTKDPAKDDGTKVDETLTEAEKKAKEIAPTLSGGTVDLSNF